LIFLNSFYKFNFLFNKSYFIILTDFNQHWKICYLHWLFAFCNTYKRPFF